MGPGAAGTVHYILREKGWGREEKGERERERGRGRVNGRTQGVAHCDFPRACVRTRTAERCSVEKGRGAQVGRRKCRRDGGGALRAYRRRRRMTASRRRLASCEDPR